MPDQHVTNPAPANPTGIGAAIRRKEDMRFLLGRGNYVADMKFQNMTFGVLLRSPHAHARIKSIDTSEAKKLPGIVYLMPCGKSPHGVDVSPDGKYVAAWLQGIDRNIWIYDIARQTMTRFTTDIDSSAVSLCASPIMPSSVNPWTPQRR